MFPVSRNDLPREFKFLVARLVGGSMSRSDRIDTRLNLDLNELIGFVDLLAFHENRPESSSGINT